MTKRPNPYEAPTHCSADDASTEGLRLSRDMIFYLFLIPLIPTTGWAILRVSPLGVFLPAVTGIVISIKHASSLKRFLLSVAVAYAVGISAIVVAHVCIEVIHEDPSYLDDIWRNKMMRLHSGFGIFGAVIGAFVSMWLAQSTPTRNGAELRNAPEIAS